METGLRSVLDLPFSDRRYIAVIDDNEFDVKKREFAYDTYAEAVVDAIALVVPGGPLVKAIAMVSSKSAAIWWKNRAKGGPKRVSAGGLIQAIPLREANRFKFLGGCAEVGRAYAANPLQDSTYYSLETYNDDMIDHKLSELERILNGLGARRHEIIFNGDEQLTAEFEGGGKRVAAVDGRANLKTRRAQRFERSGTSSGRDAMLPANLVWLDREPSWQALAESRMEHGREEFGLRVNLEQNLQISAKITAGFKLLGLEVGADYSKEINFSLSVRGSFVK